MNLYGAFDGSKRPGTLFVAFPGSPHQCLEHAWVPEKLSDPDEHIGVKSLQFFRPFFEPGYPAVNATLDHRRLVNRQIHAKRFVEQAKHLKDSDIHFARSNFVRFFDERRRRMAVDRQHSSRAV
ncbi:MAG: hypothetical protein WB608_23945 [Terracidiphilus sp.]